MLVIDGYKLDEAAVEAFVELRNAQPPKDRLKYFNVATESINNPQTRVKMVQKLYEDLMKHTDIDFGVIPLSKGDFTRYKHYDTMVDTIKSLGLVLKDGEETFGLTEKLFNMLIACRSDFEYGYKFEIDLIKTAYCTLVIALHRMIDICIVRYVDSLKQKTGIKLGTSNLKTENLLVIQGVRGILKSYDKGEWTEMISSFKKGRNNWLGTVGAVAKSVGLITATSTGVALAPAGVAVAGVIGLIVFIILLRKIVYVFYSSAYKIDDAIRRNKAFLEYTIKNSENQSPTAVIRQEAMLDKFNRIQDVIETRVFAENTKATKALKEANKNRFSIADLGPDNFASANIVETTAVPTTTNTVTEPVEPPVSNAASDNQISFF